jgi:hypothetical protein
MYFAICQRPNDILPINQPRDERSERAPFGGASGQWSLDEAPPNAAVVRAIGNEGLLRRKVARGIAEKLIKYKLPF